MTNGTNPQGYDQQDYPQQQTPQQQYNQPQPVPQPQYAPPLPPPQPVRQYPPGYNPEKESIKSMLNIAGIVAIIFGVLLALWGAWSIYAVSQWDALYHSMGSAYSVGAGAYIVAALPLIFGVLDFIIFMQTKTISAMVDRRQYVEAKSKTLIWTILGFILGGVIIGIVLLIAYLKFDPLIRAQMQQYPPRQPYQQAPQQPQYQHQQPYQQAPPPQPVQEPQPQQPQYQQYPPQ